MSFLTCICTMQVNLCKNYHTSDMSRISAEGLNHYTVVYGLNCIGLKNSVGAHWTMQWKIIEDCFRYICNIGSRHKEPCYCWADFNTPEASMITEVKTMKELGLCYKYSRPHFQASVPTIKVSPVTSFKTRQPHSRTTRRQLYTQISWQLEQQ